MRTIFCVLLIGVVSLWANLYEEGERLYAKAKYDEAGVSYERYYLKHPDSDSSASALFKSAQSYFFARSTAAKHEQRAFEIIDKILIIQEPEDPYYYKAILFKTYMYMQKKEYEKAQSLYSSMAIYATLSDRAQSNVICYELYKTLGDTVKSNYCLKKIKQSNGMSAVYAEVEVDSKSIAERPKIIISENKSVAEVGEFSIQVGAFSSKQNAEGLKNAYSDMGRTVMVRESRRDAGTLYLVWVGKFESKDAAQAFGDAYIADKEEAFRVVSIN